MSAGGDELGFHCPACGSDGIRVERLYTRSLALVYTIPCTCGTSEGGVAWERRVTTAERWCESGALDDTHHVDWLDDEKVDDALDEEIGHDVFCASCLDDAGEFDIEVEEDAEGTEQLNEDQGDEWYVKCAGCGREIEFGWSHPERGGRIWPAECSDFDPWKSWPEPRYQESWRAKGWLRPIKPRHAADIDEHTRCRRP